MVHKNFFNDNVFNWTLDINTVILALTLIAQIYFFVKTINNANKQSKKQFDNRRILDKLIVKNTIKSEFYENLQDVLKSCSFNQYVIDITSTILEMKGNIKKIQMQTGNKDGGYRIRKIAKHELAESAKSGDSVEKFFKEQASIDHLLDTINNYSIVLEHIQLFVLFLKIKLKHIEGTFHNLLIDFHTIAYEDDNDKIIQIFDCLHTSYLEIRREYHDYGLWIDDLKVYLQNNLLGEVFERNLAVRSVQEIDEIVLTDNDPEMIKKIESFVNKHKTWMRT